MVHDQTEIRLAHISGQQKAVTDFGESVTAEESTQINEEIL